MGMLKMLACCVLVVAAALGLSACDGKATAVNVVQSAYTLTSQVQAYVTNVDPNNLAQQLQGIKAPLSTVALALAFAKPYVSNSNIANGIDSVIASINQIAVQIDTVNPNTVGSLRQNVLDKLVTTQETLKTLGEYLGAEIKYAEVKGAITIADINSEAEELAALMRE